MPFADLHCHPAFWPFNRKSVTDPKDTDYHIWNVQYSKKALRKLKKGKRATYSQANFATLTEGDVRLVFASLYAIEKGFFMGNKATGNNANIVGGLFNQLFISWSGGVRKVLSILLFPFSRLLSRVLNNEGWARDMLQKMVMTFSKERINTFQNDGYTYYNEIEREYNFYFQHQNKAPISPAPPTTLQYQLAADGNSLNAILAANKIAVVLTVEGFHSLSLEPDPANPGSLKLVSKAEIRRRIDAMKNVWNVFFVTFSHHFSNGLAGHANSLPLLLQEIADPSPLKNEGFVNPDAEEYIRYLLGINAANQRDLNAGRRILIDVKHFSASSRRQYYRDIILPYNKQNPLDKIPVIASHCGYYGPSNDLPIVDLNYLITEQVNEKDDSFVNDFYRWNINLCDEDISVIVESGGLIGVSFDQRILGQMRTRAVSDTVAITIVSRNILAFVASAAHNVKQNPERIWQCMTIGSDFDGLVDPVDDYATSSRFGVFKTRFLEMLIQLPDQRKTDLFINNNPFSPALVAELICFDNALRFTTNHFK